MSNLQKAFKNKARFGLRMAAGGVLDHGNPIPTPVMGGAMGSMMSQTTPSPMLQNQTASSDVLGSLGSTANQPSAPQGLAAATGSTVPSAMLDMVNLGSTNAAPGQGAGAQHNWLTKTAAEKGSVGTFRPGKANDPHLSPSSRPMQVPQNTPVHNTIEPYTESRSKFGIGMADGGVVPETAEQLMARMAKKYGGGAAAAVRPQVATPAPAAPAPTPTPTPAAKPPGGLGGAIRDLRNHKSQLEEAAGFADGGIVSGGYKGHEERAADRQISGLTDPTIDAAGTVVDSFPYAAAQFVPALTVPLGGFAGLVHAAQGRPEQLPLDAASMIPGGRAVSLAKGSKLVASKAAGLVGRSTNALQAMDSAGAMGKNAYAEGGIVHGPGTATSDSVPVNLSRGEAVLPVKTVAHMGGPEQVEALIEATNGKPTATRGLRAGGHYEAGNPGWWQGAKNVVSNSIDGVKGLASNPQPTPQPPMQLDTPTMQAPPAPQPQAGAASSEAVNYTKQQAAQEARFAAARAAGLADTAKTGASAVAKKPGLIAKGLGAARAVADPLILAQTPALVTGVMKAAGADIPNAAAPTPSLSVRGVMDGVVGPADFIGRGLAQQYADHMPEALGGLSKEDVARNHANNTSTFDNYDPEHTASLMQAVNGERATQDEPAANVNAALGAQPPGAGAQPQGLDMSPDAQVARAVAAQKTNTQQFGNDTAADNLIGEMQAGANLPSANNGIARGNAGLRNLASSQGARDTFNAAHSIRTAPDGSAGDGITVGLRTGANGKPQASFSGVGGPSAPITGPTDSYGNSMAHTQQMQGELERMQHARFLSEATAPNSAYREGGRMGLADMAKRREQDIDLQKTGLTTNANYRAAKYQADKEAHYKDVEQGNKDRENAQQQAESASKAADAQIAHAAARYIPQTGDAKVDEPARATYASKARDFINNTGVKDARTGKSYAQLYASTAPGEGPEAAAQLLHQAITTNRLNEVLNTYQGKGTWGRGESAEMPEITGVGGAKMSKVLEGISPSELVMQKFIPLIGDKNIEFDDGLGGKRSIPASEFKKDPDLMRLILQQVKKQKSDLDSAGMRRLKAAANN